MKRWKEIDDSTRVTHLEKEDKCFFAREFKRNQGYKAGETNSMIINFKMSPLKKNDKAWFFRNKDLKRLAAEASELLKLDSNVHVTSVPSSKIPTDPLYDNRFEDFFSELKKIRQNINIVFPIGNHQSVQASHHGGTRDVDELIANMKWNGFPNGAPEHLLVFDDILTSGAHFKAYKIFLRNNGFNGNVYGVFLARTVNSDPFDDFDIID